MIIATGAWQMSGAVGFIYDRSQDANATSSNTGVDFNVRPATQVEENLYPLVIANAFFPHYHRVDRELIIYQKAFDQGNRLDYTMKHEVGHILGLRHENIWWDPLHEDTGIADNELVTELDTASIMYGCHYPGYTGNYDLSPLDREGINKIYTYDSAVYGGVESHGPFGGYGGGVFCLLAPFHYRIDKITLSGGVHVDSIKVHYVDSNDNTLERKAGGSGGSEKELAFDIDEVITKIDLYSVQYVNYIKITTNKGRSIEAGNVWGTPATIEGRNIIGFFGKSGSFIDRIGCYDKLPQQGGCECGGGTAITIPPNRFVNCYEINTPYKGYHLDTRGSEDYGFTFLGFEGEGSNVIADKKGEIRGSGYFRQDDTLPSEDLPGRRYVRVYALSSDVQTIEGSTEALNYTHGNSWHSITFTISGLKSNWDYRIGIGRGDSWRADWRLVGEWADVKIYD